MGQGAICLVVAVVSGVILAIIVPRALAETREAE
jgi:hypothetical protein